MLLLAEQPKCSYKVERMAVDAPSCASRRQRKAFPLTEIMSRRGPSMRGTQMEARGAADLLRSALKLLHQVAHKAAARGLALALLLAPPALLPIVAVRILLYIDRQPLLHW